MFFAIANAFTGEETADTNSLDKETNTEEIEEQTDTDRDLNGDNNSNNDKNKQKENQDSKKYTSSTDNEESNKVTSTPDNKNDIPDKENASQKNSLQQENKKQNGDATATVTRVVDGDTIEINLNGKTEDVRLLLVDTPETVHPSEPVQPYGPEASQFAKNKLSGKKVRIEYDGPKRDKYDRLLSYLWVDGKNFNKMLLRQGLARYAYVFDPPYTHSDTFMKAQNKAKSEGKGIWSRNNYVTSDGFNYQEQKQTENTTANNESSSSSTSSGSSRLKYNPNGPDRDCGDFDTQQEAQDFYESAGGPGSDPHRLDGNDDDGVVCETLPAA
ncbi:nuclease [Lentibacillus salicampi]|uniref:Nuclease n=2 Tax=Lentibacillus salicampi TaxID=175306 RepID=A0A4Y9ABH4_9BACI|nr:nuclease [Lentibacillus salicampi]